MKSGYSRFGIDLKPEDNLKHSAYLLSRASLQLQLLMFKAIRLMNHVETRLAQVNNDTP